MAEELKERKAFEAHMRVGGYSNHDKHPDGSYVSSAMELWWQGWKARAQLPSQWGEAVEVVAHMYQHEETGVTGFVDQQQVDWGFEKNNQRLHLCGELMTVAQHQRILAASVGSAEPVAWRYTEKTPEGFEYKPEFSIKRWVLPHDGWEETPLYTHPADQVAEPDAELVALLHDARLQLYQAYISREDEEELQQMIKRIDAKLASLKGAP